MVVYSGFGTLTPEERAMVRFVRRVHFTRLDHAPLFRIHCGKIMPWNTVVYIMYVVMRFFRLHRRDSIVRHRNGSCYSIGDRIVLRFCCGRTDLHEAEETEEGDGTSSVRNVPKRSGGPVHRYAQEVRHLMNCKIQKMTTVHRFPLDQYEPNSDRIFTNV